MSSQFKVIALSAACGLSTWVADALLDYLVFYEGTFWDLLIADVPRHELYIRSVILAVFVVFGLIVSRHLTARRRAEEARRESEFRFRSILDSEPECVKMVAADGRLLEMNPAGLAMIEADSLEQVRGLSIYDLIAPPHHRAFEALNRRVFQGESGTLEFEIVGLKGACCWMETHAVPLRDLKGAVTAHLAVTRDMTERKRAGEQRERTIERQQKLNLLQGALVGPGGLEEKLKKITDGVVETFGADFCRIWITRPGDRCDSGCIHATVTAGPHVCRQRSRCLHMMASSGRYTHIDGEVHRRVPFGCYKIGRVAAGEDDKFLTNDVPHDSRIHNHQWAAELGLVSFAGYKLSDAGGQAVGVMALFAKQEISRGEDALLQALANTTTQVVQAGWAEEELARHRDRLADLVKERTRELEEAHRELLGKERLATLGRLIATVTHEIRNPLGTIRSAIYSIGTRLGGEDPAVERALDRAKRNVVRCDMIIEELLDYTRSKGLEPVPTIVDEWLADVLDEQAIPEGITLTRNLDSGRLVALDRERLRRCVVNLITNACQAVQDRGESGGRLTVETAAPNDRLEVRITDNGPGMAPDLLERIFEPLYSTRSFGVGLGLPVVRQIMGQHGGGVEMDSEPGKGTRATLWLPLPGERSRPDEQAARLGSG